MIVDARAACSTEVRRCQRNIDAGGSKDFWLRRLEAAAMQYEAAAAILRMQIAAIQQTKGKEGG